MKIAQLNSAAQESWEDYIHFKSRTYYSVDDNYDFVAENASDITTIDNFKFLFERKRLKFNDYRNSVSEAYVNIYSSNWSSLSMSEKEILAQLILVDKTLIDGIYTEEEQERLQDIISYNNKYLRDRAMVESTDTVNFSSSSYVDIPGLLYTTKDLGDKGTYKINVSLSRYHTKSGINTHFAISVGGVIINEKTMYTYANEIHTVALVAVVSNVAQGTDIKVMTKTTSTNNVISFRTLSVDGVIDETVL